MNAVRATLATLGTTALLTGLAGPAFAAPSAESTSSSGLCRLSVRALVANDTQENRDETYVRTGDSQTPTRTYTAFQERTNLGQKDFVDSVRIGVVEADDGPDTLIGDFRRGCSLSAGETTVEGSGAIYTVRWRIDPL